MVELVDHKLSQLGMPLREQEPDHRKKVRVTTKMWSVLLELVGNPLGFFAKMKFGFHESPDPDMRLLIRSSGDEGGGLAFGQEGPSNLQEFKPVFEKRWGKIDDTVEQVDDTVATRLHDYAVMCKGGTLSSDKSMIRVNKSTLSNSESNLDSDTGRAFDDDSDSILDIGSDDALDDDSNIFFDVSINSDKKYLLPDTVRKRLSVNDSQNPSNQFDDPETQCTFSIYLDEKNSEVVLAFPGAVDEKKTILAADAIWGGIPSNFAQADQLVHKIKTHLATINTSLPEKKKYSLRLVGHAMGGGIAAYAGCKNGIPFTTFNPMSLGEGLLRDIGKERLEQAPTLGSRYVNECDPVSDTTKAKGFASALARVIPGEHKFLGKPYILPKEYIGSDDGQIIHEQISTPFEKKQEEWTEFK